MYSILFYIKTAGQSAATREPYRTAKSVSSPNYRIKPLYLSLSVSIIALVHTTINKVVFEPDLMFYTPPKMETRSAKSRRLQAEYVAHEREQGMSQSEDKLSSKAEVTKVPLLSRYNVPGSIQSEPIPPHSHVPAVIKPTISCVSVAPPTLIHVALIHYFDLAIVNVWRAYKIDLAVRLTSTPVASIRFTLLSNGHPQGNANAEEIRKACKAVCILEI